MSVDKMERNNMDVPAPDWSNYLNDIYYDARQPGSFQSFNKIKQTIRKEGRYQLGNSRLRRWLQNQQPYSRNRLFLPHRLKRARVFVQGLYDQFEADLADYQKLENENDGYRYLLVMIDVFSRFVWVEPIKNKTNVEVIKAFEKFFRQGHVPRHLRTDRGTEFTARVMKQFFNHYNISHFVSLNEVKANYAERVIKTIKSKLGRYMTFHRTGRYIDGLSDIVESYNSTIHTSTQIPPNQVNEENEIPLWWMQNKPRHKFTHDHTLPRFKFKEGDHVRIPYLPGVFSREYHARWTEEIFHIVQKFRRDDINMYRVEDKDQEEILGTFYEGELQLVLANQKNQWRIERILKEQGSGINRQAWVKFKGWPEFYNRWIPYAQAQRDLNAQTEQTQQ